jgi:hypothetical protein
MPIVSSVITADSPQKDGRRWIGEAHTDQVAVIHTFTYLAPNAAWDANAAMTARVPIINGDLTAGEIGANVAAVTALGSVAVPTFVYSTVPTNVAALRAAYATATHEQAVMIGDYLSSLTDAQLETAFGLTAGQVATLRTNKLTPAATLAASIRAAAGQ